MTSHPRQDERSHQTSCAPDKTPTCAGASVQRRDLNLHGLLVTTIITQPVKGFVTVDFLPEGVCGPHDIVPTWVALTVNHENLPAHFTRFKLSFLAHDKLLDDEVRMNFCQITSFIKDHHVLPQEK